MIKGKHILLGVTGGIAAYKTPLLVRELKRGGAEVRVVMTESAKQFVTPLTLSTVSGNEVTVGMFPDQSAGAVDMSTWHVELGRWADVMILAPATANTIAKVAMGLADNAVTTLVLALRCPLVIAPTMDVDMWENPITQQNVTKLREMGCFVLPPECGELASGLVGAGRMPEIEAMVKYVDDVLERIHRDLEGKKILITAGPTHEPIDPVRFIGNRSSGKMGYALANAAALRGAEVTLVSGPVQLGTPRNVKRIDVETSDQMFEAVRQHAASADAVVMAAAVADYAPLSAASHKIKKENRSSFSIELRETRDILESLGMEKNGKILVGFALETENEETNARDKLVRKNLDLIVLNNPNVEGAGFGSETNVVTIIRKSGEIQHLPKLPKFDVANVILDHIVNLLR